MGTFTRLMATGLVYVSLQRLQSMEDLPIADTQTKALLSMASRRVLLRSDRGVFEANFDCH